MLFRYTFLIRLRHFITCIVHFLQEFFKYFRQMFLYVILILKISVVEIFYVLFMIEIILSNLKQMLCNLTYHFYLDEHFF